MPFTEDDLLALSGLQHLVYCERQAALIHVEQVWLDNTWTVEGTNLHQNVISGRPETRGEVRISRDLPLRSSRLGLSGRADVIEFHRVDEATLSGARIHDWPGRWQPYPVEYKRGRPKRHRADEVQICAQALCLEEMLGVEIQEGALFYGQTQHRTDVTFDAQLRETTESAARRFREIFEARLTPPAVYKKELCDECSLIEICRPRAAKRRVDRYLTNTLRQASSDSGR
jgi:CRISPR-associated exonuclease Cas4